MTGPDSTEPVPVTLARLEGKVDAALAGHTAKLDEHGRSIGDLKKVTSEQSERLRVVELVQAKGSPRAPWWTVVVTIAAIVSIGVSAAALFVR